jgi:hypothetical protein
MLPSRVEALSPLIVAWPACLLLSRRIRRVPEGYRRGRISDRRIGFHRSSRTSYGTHQSPSLQHAAAEAIVKRFAGRRAGKRIDTG